jgi:hypothetical protein
MSPGTAEKAVLTESTKTAASESKRAPQDRVVESNMNSGSKVNNVARRYKGQRWRMRGRDVAPQGESNKALLHKVPVRVEAMWDFR